MSRFPEYTEREEAAARWAAAGMWLGVLVGAVAMLVWSCV